MEAVSGIDKNVESLAPLLMLVAQVILGFASWHLFESDAVPSKVEELRAALCTEEDSLKSMVTQIQERRLVLL